MEGNLKLRLMSVGRAREVFKQQFRDDPSLREVYKKYIKDNQEELGTMGESYRAIGKAARVPSRQIH